MLLKIKYNKISMNWIAIIQYLLLSKKNNNENIQSKNFSFVAEHQNSVPAWSHCWQRATILT